MLRQKSLTGVMKEHESQLHLQVSYYKKLREGNLDSLSSLHFLGKMSNHQILRHAYIPVAKSQRQ